jgi:hypothetical protein
MDTLGWGIGEIQYRVPKVPVSVALVLDGGEQLAGDLHVLPEAGRHQGRERVVDLLHVAEPFLPLTTSEGTVLLAKQRIVVLRTGDPLDAGWDLSELQGAPEVEAEVRLAGQPAGNDRLIGTLRLAMPEGQRRLLDYLNVPDPYLPVMLDDGPALVARRYIRSLRQR